MKLNDVVLAVKTNLVNSGIEVSNLKDARTILETVLQTVMAITKQGDTVRINSVGAFKLKHRKAKPERQGRNPSTGETITIAATPAKSIVTFKESKVSE